MPSFSASHGLALAADVGPLVPAAHPDELVVDDPDHLAGHVVGLVARQPRHHRRAVLRVHRVPLALGDLVGLERLARSRHGRGDAGEAGGTDAVRRSRPSGRAPGRAVSVMPDDRGLGGRVVRSARSCPPRPAPDVVLMMRPWTASPVLARSARSASTRSATSTTCRARAPPSPRPSRRPACSRSRRRARCRRCSRGCRACRRCRRPGGSARRTARGSRRSRSSVRRCRPRPRSAATVSSAALAAALTALAPPEVVHHDLRPRGEPSPSRGPGRCRDRSRSRSPPCRRAVPPLPLVSRSSPVAEQRV